MDRESPIISIKHEKQLIATLVHEQKQVYNIRLRVLTSGETTISYWDVFIPRLDNRGNNPVVNVVTQLDTETKEPR